MVAFPSAVNGRGNLLPPSGHRKNRCYRPALLSQLSMLVCLCLCSPPQAWNSGDAFHVVKNELPVLLALRVSEIAEGPAGCAWLVKWPVGRGDSGLK